MNREVESRVHHYLSVILASHLRFCSLARWRILCVVITWVMTKPLEKWLCVWHNIKLSWIRTRTMRKYTKRGKICTENGEDTYEAVILMVFVAAFSFGQVHVWYVADRIWWNVPQCFTVIFHSPVLYIHWSLIQELALRPQSHGDRPCSTRIMKEDAGSVMNLTGPVKSTPSHWDAAKGSLICFV
jgi:hypothetical protein